MRGLEYFTLSFVIAFFALVMALGGCAPYPQRFAYKNLPPDMKIIRAEPWRVDAHCRKHAKTFDDGTPVTSSKRIRCCWFVNRRVMYVGYGDDSCVVHELKHAEGVSAAEADRWHAR